MSLFEQWVLIFLHQLLYMTKDCIKIINRIWAANNRKVIELFSHTTTSKEISFNFHGDIIKIVYLLYCSKIHRIKAKDHQKCSKSYLTLLILRVTKKIRIDFINKSNN